MEEVLYGSVWGLISRLLATDDVVKIRTAACRWNVGDKYGLLGDTFFFLLKMNSSRSPGTMIRKVNARDTLLRLRNPILDGIRKFGLHSPQKDALPAPRELRMRGLSSFRSTLHELSGCQTVDTQWYQDKDTWGFSRDGDEYISMSSGSLSPDLGDACWETRGGTAALKALTGTVTSTFGAEGEETGEYEMKNLRQVREGSLSGDDTSLVGPWRCLGYAYNSKTLECGQSVWPMPSFLSSFWTGSLRSN